VLAAYLPALEAGFVWDDNDYVFDNPTLRAPGGLVRIWLDPRASPQYYPLVFTSFWLEARLWGMSPAGYHFTNVVLHGLSAVLFWQVLTRLGVPGAWLAAALFALHPVQVESVAWVSERKNILSGLLYWAALLAYLRFAGVPEARPGRGGWYAAALVLFLGALLSKTVTCTLPAVLALLLWWQRGRLTRRDLACLAPLFLLGAGMGLATAFLEIHQVGAAGTEYALGRAERLLIAGRAVWFYLGKLALPVNLTFIYSRWQIDPGDPRQWLFPAAAAALAVVLWWARDRLGRGPLVAYLCFVGTLFPALGFFDVYPFRYSFVADHFQYLASAAPLAALAAGAALAARRAPPAAGRLLAGALLLTLGTLTWSRAHVYRDSLTLFQDTAARNPGCWMAWNNLGNLSLARKEFRRAEEQYRECVALKPDHYRARRGLAEALVGERRLDEARAQLRLAEQTLRSQGGVAQEYLDLGGVWEWTGDDAEAERLYRLALEVSPDSPTAHFRLGNVLAKRSRFEEAIPHLRATARASPDNAEAHYYLAQALQAGGFQEEAAAEAAEALRLAEAAGDPALRHVILERFASKLRPAP
jgi:tetratricopeptide (TPR) repeat protein